GNTTNQYTPVKVSGGHSFVSIAAGNHTCGVTTGGDAYCWGYDAFGGLGNGSGGHQNTPVKVSGNHSFVSVTAGNYHSCAVGADGDSYCWGWNAQGQLGIGNTAQQMTTPVKILGEHSFVSVTAGTTHTCGVTAAGDAYCWGSGANGRLGTGNLTDQTTPVLVVEP
ncbi:MAG: RCC1 repeat-containing protein, partial [Acidimicrobiia bacterium]